VGSDGRANNIKVIGKLLELRYRVEGKREMVTLTVH
jgi:hypothetical protein